MHFKVLFALQEQKSWIAVDNPHISLILMNTMSLIIASWRWWFDEMVPSTRNA